MSSWFCNKCGAEAYHDGRCGDGPVLLCKCIQKGEWVEDASGQGYYVRDGAEPIKRGSGY